MKGIHVWDNFLPQFSEYFCIICTDVPGHGKSLVYAKVHTMDFMAERVNKILIENETNECVMVGHSMGGYVMRRSCGNFQKIERNMLPQFSCFS